MPNLTVAGKLWKKVREESEVLYLLSFACISLLSDTSPSCQIPFRLGRPVIDGLTSEQSRVKPSTLRFIRVTVPEAIGNRHLSSVGGANHARPSASLARFPSSQDEPSVMVSSQSPH